MADDDAKMQFVQIPFVGGLNEKTVVEYSDPAQQQSSVVNGQFTHVGAIDKRIGMRVLGGANMPIPNPRSIHATSKSGLLLFGKDAAYSYSESTTPAGATGAQLVGRLPDVHATQTSITASGNATGLKFADYGTNLRMVMWMDSGRYVQYYVYNTVTGATVVPQNVLTGPYAAGSAVLQLMFVPNATTGKVVMVLLDNPNGLSSFIYDPVTQIWGGGAIDNTNTPVTADATVFAGDPGFSFLVASMTVSAGVYSVRLYQVQLSGAVTFSSAIATGLSLTAPFMPRVYVDAHYGASEFVWVSYGATQTGFNNARIVTRLGDGTFAAGSDFIANQVSVASAVVSDVSPILRLDASHCWQSFYIMGAGSGTIGGVGSTNVDGCYSGLQGRFSNTGTIVSVTASPIGITAYGKPIAVPRAAGSQGSQALPDVVMPCLFTLSQTLNNAGIAPPSGSTGPSQQSTLYLVRFPADCSNLTTAYLAANPYPVCTVAPRQLSIAAIGAFLLNTGPTGPGATVGPVPHMSCGVPAIGVVPARAAVAGGLIPVDREAQIANTISTYGALFAADFYFDQTLTGATVELGDGAHISGGVPCVFDGNIVREEVFFSYPEGPKTSTAAGAGILVGNYGWAGVYRYVGADGNEVKSAPAFTTIRNIGAGVDVTVYFYRCPMSYIYTRDVVGSAGAVPSASTKVYLDVYRTVNNGSTYYLVNTLDATPPRVFTTSSDMFCSFVDNKPDTAIQSASLLYTTGGTLDNVNPPSSRCHCTHKNRLWLVDATGTTIWFSNAFQPGAAIGFNETYTIPLIEGGAITSLASMDDKLVIFKSNAIYIIQGDPPPLTGIGSSLTEPVRIVSDVGTIDWRAVKIVPKGLIFRASAGIYILGRDLQVTWIGNVIKDTLDTSDIYSADLVPTAQHIRFLLDTGIVLVYDYFLDNWTTFSYAQTGAGNLTDATVQNGSYTILAPSGYAYQEKAIHGFAAPWKDQDSAGVDHFVPSSVTTPGVRINGVQGYQRVRRAQFYAPATDPHDITISLAVDNDPTVRQTAFWTATQLSANAYGDQCEVHLASDINKCESVSVTVADSDVSSLSVTGQGVTFTGLGIEIQQIGKRYRRLPATARQ